MNYTVKINGINEKAQSIINMLKVFSMDYDFLQIIEESENFYDLTNEQEIEFEKRYEYVMQNPEFGKTWEEVEKKLLSK